ncbi:unnamed protein product [Effrenium voratum]|uniref:Uncharacterized protein n=1 Tax=Effrenium voratum TaxID=2562239 RepID=A0AA36N236_9DINO|nr:unnamed protein product [Effrenium voratum]
MSVTKFLKEHGQDVAVLPGPPAVEKKKVYTSIASCVAALDLATTFVMKSGVIIADSTDHCAVDKVSDGVGDREDRRICSVDIIGLMGTLSLAIRFYALAANSCVEIVGDSVPSACAAAGAGLSAGVFATVAPAMNLQASCEKAFALWDPDTWPSDQNLRQSATKQAPKVQPEDQGFTVVADP